MDEIAIPSVTAMVADLQVLDERLTQHGMALLVRDSGLHHLIHPSTKGARWQITTFDDTGILGDTQHASVLDMACELSGASPVPHAEIESHLQLIVRAETIGYSQPAPRLAFSRLPSN